MSDRIVVMAEGGIRQVGTPSDIYLRPADAFVAGFVGDANLIEACHAGYTPQGQSLFRTADGEFIVVAGDPRGCEAANRLIVRPESISLCSRRESGTPQHGVDPAHGDASPDGINRLPGRLVSRAYMGAFVELRAEAGAQEILVKLPSTAQPDGIEIGEPVVLQWESTSVKALLA